MHMQHVPCVQHTADSMQHATCSVRHATCSTEPAPCTLQRTALQQSWLPLLMAAVPSRGTRCMHCACVAQPAALVASRRSGTRSGYETKRPPMRSSASTLRRRTTLPKSSGWPTSPRRFGTPAPGLGQCGFMLHTTGALRPDIVSASTGFLFFCLCCGAGLGPAH